MDATERHRNPGGERKPLVFPSSVARPPASRPSRIAFRIRETPLLRGFAYALAIEIGLALLVGGSWILIHHLR